MRHPTVAAALIPAAIAAPTTTERTTGPIGPEVVRTSPARSRRRERAAAASTLIELRKRFHRFMPLRRGRGSEGRLATSTLLLPEQVLRFLNLVASRIPTVLNSSRPALQAELPLGALPQRPPPGLRPAPRRRPRLQPPQTP